jgi:GH35 family endo-1,4-beta-xylanase
VRKLRRVTLVTATDPDSARSSIAPTAPHSLWGLADPNSWLNDTGCVQRMLVLDTEPAPLAFDEVYQRKPWWGAYDALDGCIYP